MYIVENWLFVTTDKYTTICPFCVILNRKIYQNFLEVIFMYAFIGAMEEEVAGIRAALSDPVTRTIAGLSFTEGSYKGHRCVAVKAGVGKVNAALCTQALIDHYDVSCVINTGIAGSLDPAVGIGDIVLCTEAIQHDVDAGAFGYKPGQIPQMDCSVFPADEGLRKEAREAAADLPHKVRVHEGIVVTGDQFICSKEKKEALRARFHGMCCEMEGAAIAHVAWLNQKPFLIVRAISDNADNDAEMDYTAFERQAIDNSVALSLSLLSRSGAKV